MRESGEYRRAALPRPRVTPGGVNTPVGHAFSVTACCHRVRHVENVTYRQSTMPGLELHSFDHFVKRNLRCKGYVRYVDDFLLFSNDQSELNEWRGGIIAKLGKFRLTLHETKCQSRPVTEGIPFLGFIVYPDYRRLKRQNGFAFQRKFKNACREVKQGDLSFEDLKSIVQGWVNHVRYANTWKLRRAILGTAC